MCVLKNHGGAPPRLAQFVQDMYRDLLHHNLYVVDFPTYLLADLRWFPGLRWWGYDRLLRPVLPRPTYGWSMNCLFSALSVSKSQKAHHSLTKFFVLVQTNSRRPLLRPEQLR